MEGAPKSENEELLQALLTVTESMIFFQEFIEGEIGEMSYFRDSGSHAKLVETLNMLRSKVFKAAGPFLKKVNGDSLSKSAGTNEEEQVKVDVDFSEDSNEANELTIREVFSMSRPLPSGISGSTVMRSNSSITITPVFKKMDEKKIMDQVPPPPPPPPPTNLASIIFKNCGPPPPPFIAANTPFTVSNFPPIIHGSNGAGSKIFSNFREDAFGTISLAEFVDKFANERKSDQQQNSKKNKTMKKSALPKEKKIDAQVASAPVGNASVKTMVVTSNERPLNLKKKEKPYQCEKCPKRYTSRGVMSRHMKETHNPNDPQFPCFYCPAKFRTGPTRLEHMNNIHTEALQSLRCPICGRKSNTLSGKRNHMMLCHKKQRRQAALAGERDVSQQSPALSPTDSGVEADKSPSFA